VNKTEAVDVHHHRGDARGIYKRKADQAFRGCAPAASSTGEHDGEPARLQGALRALDSRPLQPVRRPRLGRSPRRPYRAWTGVPTIRISAARRSWPRTRTPPRPNDRKHATPVTTLRHQGASIDHHCCGTNLWKHSGDHPLKVGTPIPQRRPRTFATLTSHIERDRC